jgi:excisionase family DNA binding protein
MESAQLDVLTVDGTAELLKIPCTYSYKLTEQGKILAKKVDSHWRFHRLKLVKWIADVTIKADPEAD